MSQTYTILLAIMMVVLVLLISPNILAMNRSKTMRNIVLWLGVFLILALVYKFFGPNSDHAIFQDPALGRGGRSSHALQGKDLPHQDNDADVPGALPKIHSY